jgi:hypothetical protein
MEPHGCAHHVIGEMLPSLRPALAFATARIAAHNILVIDDGFARRRPSVSSPFRDSFEIRKPFRFAK